jgi:HK97 family phage portal protein
MSAPRPDRRDVDTTTWHPYAPSTPGRPQGRLQAAFRALLGRGEERRAITSLPWDTGGTLSGQPAVNADTALTLVPVYSAIGLIARTVSCTPLHAYRKISDDERQRLGSLPQLFAILDLEGTLVSWLHRAIVSLATRGNAFGLITSRDGFGFPTGIQWLHPDHVTVEDLFLSGRGSYTDPVWRWNGREVPTEDMVHIPWFPVPGRVLGLSPIGAAASAISTGVSAQIYAADWFGNGGIPPGTMKNTARVLEEDEAVAIKARLVSSIRSRKPIVYGADWDYSPIAIAPHEARFVEVTQLTANQVAAIYDVPAERIGGNTGGTLRYSSPEQDQIQLVTTCLRNWYELLEHHFAAMLPNRQYVRFNVDSLIRADLAARYGAYKIARQIGLLSIDECRALEDLPPLPDGEGADHAPLAAPATDPTTPAMLPAANSDGTAQDQQSPTPLRRPRAA